MAKIWYENQLRRVVYPIIYRVSYITGGAGFQPSTLGSLGIPESPPQKKMFHLILLVTSFAHLGWWKLGLLLDVGKDLKFPSLRPLGSCFLRKNA